MKKIFLIILCSLAYSMVFSAHNLFPRRYPSEYYYVATYDNSKPLRFLGFKRSYPSHKKFTKEQKEFIHFRNSIIDSLDFINWDRDTMYYFYRYDINDICGMAFWTSKAGYYIKIKTDWNNNIESYVVQPLDTALTTFFPGNAKYTNGWRMFVDVWSSYDTTRIKTLMLSSTPMDDIMDTGRIIILNGIPIENTMYYFFVASPWCYDTTVNNTRDINLYTNKDVFNHLEYE